VVKRERGFSLIELLIVLAVIGVISVIVVPQLIDAYERSRQRGTMADMRSIAVANGTYHTDNGSYAGVFGDLMPLFMNPVPPNDSWGNPWAYVSASADEYALTSYGQDGTTGPAAPIPWTGDPYTADLQVVNGTFTQAPRHGQ